MWARLDVQLGAPPAPRPGAPRAGGGPRQPQGPPPDPSHTNHQRKSPSARARDTRRREEWIKRREQQQQVVPPLQVEENQQNIDLKLSQVVQPEEQQEQPATTVRDTPVYKVLVSQDSERLELRLPRVEEQSGAKVTIPQVDGGVTPPKVQNNTQKKADNKPSKQQGFDYYSIPYYSDPDEE